MSIDDKHSDHELKAYLDGVSAAYRKTANEEPSRALDKAILAAARAQAAPPSTEAWYLSRKPYAIAASLMIAVIAISLYFGSLDAIVVPAAIEEATVRAVELQRVEREIDAQAEAPQQASAERQRAASAAAPAVQLSQDFETRQLPPPVPTVGVEDSIAAPAAPAVEINRDAFARAAEPQPVIIDGLLLERIEAEAAGAPARQVADTGNRLEEIVVTGARIMRRDEGDVSYRDSREDWLAEISTMTDEFAARSRLTTARAAAARLEQQLNEEIDLYLEAYPDADIEAELEALEE